MASGATPGRESLARCRRLASALAARGIGRGDTVAVMAPNMPAALRGAFRRADGRRGAERAEHPPRRRRRSPSSSSTASAKVLLTDREFSPDRSAAPWRCSTDKPLVIDIDDPRGPRRRASGRRSTTRPSSPAATRISPGRCPADEWDAIALNYTSGTTGNPKGVVYHHRGAYLNALGNVLVWGMPPHPVYLWTLPMFHCNGWCFPWTVTALAGTHVCLRRVEAERDLRRDRRARRHPSVRRADRAEHAAQRPASERGCSARAVEMMTAGAAPPAAVIERHGGAGLPHHPCLRPDRGLWPGRWSAPGTTNGTACPPRRAGRAQGAPGRALSGARRADGRRPRDARSRCRADGADHGRGVHARQHRR